MAVYVYLTSWFRSRVEHADRGASLIEYTLMVALITLVCVASVKAFQANTTNMLSSTAEGLDAGI